MPQNPPQQHIPQPPRPPEVQRRFRVHRLQLFGVPFVVLIPILALLGLFGRNSETISASSPTLVMSVEYASTMRYKTIGTLEVTLRNVGSSEIGSADVRIPTDYLDAFSNVTATPSVSTVTAGEMVVEVSAMAPGDTRVVSIELQGEEYGWASGAIRAVGEGGEPVEARVTTLVLP